MDKYLLFLLVINNKYKHLNSFFMRKILYFCARNINNNATRLLVVLCVDFEGKRTVNSREVKIVCSSIIVLEHDPVAFGLSSNGKNWTIKCHPNCIMTQVKPTRFSPVDWNVLSRCRLDKQILKASLFQRRFFIICITIIIYIIALKNKIIYLYQNCYFLFIINIWEYEN